MKTTEPKKELTREDLISRLKNVEHVFHGFPVQQWQRTNLPKWFVQCDAIASNVNNDAATRLKALEFLIVKADGKPRESFRIGAESKTLSGLVRALDRIRRGDDGDGSGGV